MNSLRKSNCIIEIPLPAEESLLIHGYTGVFVKIPARVSDYLNHLNSPGEEKSTFRPSSDIMDKMKQGGFITDLSPEDEIKFKVSINKNMHKSRLKSLPSYMIIPSYTCNFNCTYCYQKDMRRSRGKEYVEKILTKDSVSRICSGINEIEKDIPGKCKNHEERHITFYGGEPLVRQNREIVEYTMQSIKKNCGNTIFSAISNGYELEHFTSLLGKEGISEIQITLDSILNIHNKKRFVKHHVDKGSYNKIAENITLALDAGMDVHVRINTDMEAMDYFYDLAVEIEKRGWTRYDNFKTAFAPIFDPKKGDSGNLYNYGSLYKEVHRLRDTFSAGQKEVFRVSQEDYFESMKESLVKEESLISHFKSSICNAMTTMFVFDPHDMVYACFEKVGVPEEAIGTLDREGRFIIREEGNTRWRGRIAVSNEVCKACSYTFFCGGGCAARAETTSGTMYAHYCDGFQSYFQEKVKELWLELECEHEHEHEQHKHRECTG